VSVYHPRTSVDPDSPGRDHANPAAASSLPSLEVGKPGPQSADRLAYSIDESRPPDRPVPRPAVRPDTPRQPDLHQSRPTPAHHPPPSPAIPRRRPHLGNRRPCGQAERWRASSPLYDCRPTTRERPRSRAVPMALDHVRGMCGCREPIGVAACSADISLAVCGLASRLLMRLRLRGSQSPRISLCRSSSFGTSLRSTRPIPHSVQIPHSRGPAEDSPSAASICLS
jgi:hypothetical protein